MRGGGRRLRELKSLPAWLTPSQRDSLSFSGLTGMLMYTCVRRGETRGRSLGNRLTQVWVMPSRALRAILASCFRAEKTDRSDLGRESSFGSRRRKTRKRTAISSGRVTVDWREETTLALLAFDSYLFCSRRAPAVAWATLIHGVSFPFCYSTLLHLMGNSTPTRAGYEHCCPRSLPGCGEGC